MRDRIAARSGSGVARTRLAFALLGCSGQAGEVARAIGQVLAAGFALRNARAMAARGQRLLPELAAGEVGAVGRGEASADLRHRLGEFATRALDILATCRRETLPRAAMPALLPLLREERALARVGSRRFVDLGQIDDVDRPFDGLRLLWRAATGHW